MDRDLLSKLNAVSNLLHRALYGRHAHRCFGERSRPMAPSFGGKEKLRMTMRGPVASQCHECGMREWNVPIFGSLAAMNVDQTTSRIDITDLKVQSLLQTQAQRVDGPEVDGHARLATMVDDLMDLRDREHFRQALDVLNLHRSERLPLTTAGACVEELDATVSDTQRTGGELPVVLEVEEVLPQLRLGDAIGRAPAKITQLPYGSQLADMSPITHARQMQVFAHAVVQLAGKVGLRSH